MAILVKICRPAGPVCKKDQTGKRVIRITAFDSFIRFLLVFYILCFYRSASLPAQNFFDPDSQVTDRRVPFAGSSDQNYIKTIIFREALYTEPAPGTPFRHKEEIRYFDGMGRPSQTVQAGASPPPCWMRA